MNIVFLDAQTVGEVPNLNKISELGNFTVYQNTLENEKPHRIKDADIIITNKVWIDRKAIDAAPKLKLICIAATGVNNIDLKYAEEKGIPVKNVRNYSTNSVAQTTFSILLYILNQPDYYKQYVFSGKYSHSPVFTHIGKPFWELNGKRFGIIGMGTIGQKVAEIATGFGCEVVYYSTSGKNTAQNYQLVSFQELMETSDVVSIHAPLNADTDHLINYDALQAMQSHAILLNTGRGRIVNEQDLARAIDNHLIGGAGLDVLENEPINTDNPLLKIKNTDRLYISPHIAWTSMEARKLLIDKIYTNITDFING